MGTKRVITNSDGTYSASFFNGPFGDFQTPSGAGSDPSDHHFTSKERDIESGLDYFPARYYNSNVGRFLSPIPRLFYADPTNPQSLNLYSYGRNNPLINTDPTGLDCVYINNDSGALEDFNSGDCDNSTTARANSGYYVDGTVNQIGFNAQARLMDIALLAETVYSIVSQAPKRGRIHRSSESLLRRRVESWADGEC